MRYVARQGGYASFSRPLSFRRFRFLVYFFGLSSQMYTAQPWHCGYPVGKNWWWLTLGRKIPGKAYSHDIPCLFSISHNIAFLWPWVTMALILWSHLFECSYGFSTHLSSTKYWRIKVLLHVGLQCLLFVCPFFFGGSLQVKAVFGCIWQKRHRTLWAFPDQQLLGVDPPKKGL